MTNMLIYAHLCSFIAFPDVKLPALNKEEKTETDEKQQETAENSEVIIIEHN